MSPSTRTCHLLAAVFLLVLNLSPAWATLRYQPVDGVKGFTVGYTKVINLHVETGVVSPDFDDILITHLSFRLIPHEFQPLTWRLEVQERGGAWINRINTPGDLIGAEAFAGRNASITTFRSIGTTQANREVLCGISFLHGATRCYGWVHLRAEYTHPTQPPLTLLAYAWQDDGSGVHVGHLPSERITPVLDTSGSGRLVWLSGANHRYQLQHSSTGSDWLPRGEPLSGNGHRQEIRLESPVAPAFFRLVISDTTP
jgi:hypothetical protein